jgi:hypothetical protein
MEPSITKDITPEAQPATPESFGRLVSLLARRDRLTARVEGFPAKIEQARADAAAAGDAIMRLEMDFVADDEDLAPTTLKNHEKTVRAAQERQFEAESMERALRMRLEALEGRLLELDSEVAAEIQVARVDVSATGAALLHELGEELAAAIVPVQRVIAKIGALTAITPLQNARDFMMSAYVGDLQSSMFLFGVNGGVNTAPNMLTARNEATEQAVGEVAERLQHVSDVMALVKGYRAYVPLDRRPKPYVRKGEEMEFSGTGTPPRTGTSAELIVR